MKTIFRYTNIGLLLAVVIAFGAVAGFAQNPCEDADGQTVLGDKVRAEFKDKTIDGRKKFVETGKQFLEKYGACEAAKELVDWLKINVPKNEDTIKKMIADKAEADLTARFDKAMLTKNWDEVYASGKEILDKYPGDTYRAIELVLGSIGLDETAKTPRVTKWNEETLKYAKLSIADLESGKVFKTYGIGVKDGASFVYLNKDDALGWMNYTIGYILFFDKNNKKDSLAYLYKATQMASETKSNPVVYASIGSYYYDETKKLGLEIDGLIKLQDDKDTPEVAKQKVDTIKGKVAIFNGTAEAAIDAYARAYDLAKAKPNKTYTEALNKQLRDLYNVRFGKMEGFDAFVAGTVKKPMPNPTLPVTPVSDPEPAPTTTTTTTAPTPTPGGKPAANPIKPVTPPATKPGAPAPGKSVGSGKPLAIVKKPAAKKRGA